jgi:hypothetical protein
MVRSFLGNGRNNGTSSLRKRRNQQRRTPLFREPGIRPVHRIRNPAPPMTGTGKGHIRAGKRDAMGDHRVEQGVSC